MPRTCELLQIACMDPLRMYWEAPQTRICTCTGILHRFPVWILQKKIIIFGLWQNLSSVSSPVNAIQSQPHCSKGKKSYWNLTSHKTDITCFTWHKSNMHHIWTIWNVDKCRVIQWSSSHQLDRYLAAPSGATTLVFMMEPKLSIPCSCIHECLRTWWNWTPKRIEHFGNWALWENKHSGKSDRPGNLNFLKIELLGIWTFWRLEHAGKLSILENWTIYR